MLKRHLSRDTGPTDAVRQAVWARADYCCERCGIGCAWGTGGQIHHRRPRGMGGTRRASSNTAPALALLCPTCHGEIESNRDQAREEGWLVRQGDDPEQIILTDLFGNRFIFDGDRRVDL